MGRQTWIADRCRKYGLDVTEVDGWRTRGSDAFNPYGVVCHHTAGASTGEMPSLRLLVVGRSDLPGPLCNVGLGRSGRVYVIAAGRANHAGSGGWRGLVGNSSVLGIEAEDDGDGTWTDAQRRVYPVLAAALKTGCRSPQDFSLICAHREWAPSRKIDPRGIDLNTLRHEAAHYDPAPSTPGGATVYSPPLQLTVVASLTSPGGGAWLLTSNGAIYAFGNAGYHGACNGKSYFTGRTAKTLHPSADGRYIIEATSGEKYGPDF